MFVFWEHLVKNGLSKDGKETTVLSQSSVHKAGEYLNYKTHCKLKIPQTANMSVTEVYPIGRKLCRRCFPDIPL